MEFGDFVLAFVTLDMVFQVRLQCCFFISNLSHCLHHMQPIWASTRNDLPPDPVDAFTDRPRLIQGIVDWWKDRYYSKQTNRMGLVCEAIRAAEHVFPGVGVYTIAELCYMAGKQYT